jgi:predicted nucleotidyltransferase component of viral defense system
MKMKPLMNFGDSVRARLLAIAKKENIQLEYLLLRYALERFLYRLGKSRYSDLFVLKGASVFAVWLGPLCRVTRDADVEAIGRFDPETLVSIFKEICALEYREDAVEFLLDTVTWEEIKKEDKYPGVRIVFKASIGGARVNLQFDVGFGDSIYPTAEKESFPVLLGHDKPILRVYPKYTVIAEKFSTMVARDMLNSRVKDYFDIWLISESFDLEEQVLRQAIERTFNRRQLVLPQTMPKALTTDYSSNPARQSQWNALVRGMVGVNLPESFDVAVSQIVDFLTPFIENNPSSNKMWIAQKRRWMDSVS